MFYQMSTLVNPPVLSNATTLVQSCYENMFYGCTNLTTAPALPAATLATRCYYNMFYGCSKLNYIECLATNISATNCTTGWVNGVAATGTFVKSTSMNSWTTGVNGIPSGWAIQAYGYDKYLTIISTINSNTIGWRATDSSITKTISISTDNGTTWTNVASTTATNGATLATLNTGDKLLVKGSNKVYANGSYYNCFTSTGNFNVEGNIMSLLYGDDFENQTTLTTTTNTYIFSSLFRGCTKLGSAANFVLPATTLTKATYCYERMFYGCTSLTTAPALPATTLANYCYRNMFYGCTSLTTAPALPATTLTNSCYYYMFTNCSSLTTAPALPATTLIANCYAAMFRGCSSLNYIKAMFTTTPSSTYTQNWVQNVNSTGTFVKNSSATWSVTGVHGIPTGWTVQTA